MGGAPIVTPMSSSTSDSNTNTNIISFTEDEIWEFGVPLYTLRPGDKFAITLASNPEGTRSATFVGKLIYPGIGSSLVQVARGWDSVMRWSPDTKVIALPKTAEEKKRRERVSLNPNNFDNYADTDTDTELKNSHQTEEHN